MLSTRTSKIKYDVWKLTKQQVVSLKSTILRNDGSPWPFEATSSRSWIGAPEGEQANTRGKGFNMGFNMAVRLPWTSKIFQTCQKYRKKHQRVIYIYIHIVPSMLIIWMPHRLQHNQIYFACECLVLGGVGNFQHGSTLLSRAQDWVAAPLTRGCLCTAQRSGQSRPTACSRFAVFPTHGLTLPTLFPWRHDMTLVCAHMM